MQKSQSCCWHQLIYCSTVDCFRCRPVCAWCAHRAEGLWARPRGRLLWVQGCCTDDSSTGMAEQVSAAHDSPELCFRGQNFVSGGQNFVSGDRTQFQGNFGSADRGCSLAHCTHGLWGLLFSAVKGLEDWRKIGSAWKCLRTEIVVLSYSAVTICRCASLPSCCFWCTNLWQAVNIQELTNCQHLCNRGKHLRMQQPCWCALNQWRAEKAWLLA